MLQITTSARKAMKAARERKRYQENRFRIVEAKRKRYEEFKARKKAYKEKLECMNPDCNFRGAWNPEKLEFHHLDPAKKSFNPKKASSWNAFMAEVKKCVPLCKSCHTYVEQWKKEREKEKQDQLDPIPF